MDLRKTIVDEVPPIQGDQETTLWNPRVSGKHFKKRVAICAERLNNMRATGRQLMGLKAHLNKKRFDREEWSLTLL